MKKLVALVLSLVLVLCLATAAMAEGTHTIALANINEKGVFGKLVKKGFEEACAEKGWNLVYVDNNSDGATAVNNAQLLSMRDDIEYCVDMNVDASVGQTIMDIFNEVNIPVLAVDIALPGVPFFGIDNVAMGTFNGEWAAQWIKDNWDGQVDYVVPITQIASGDIVQERVRSSVTALEAAGIEIGEVVEIEGQNDTAVIQQRFNDFLTGHPDTNKIFVFTINENGGMGTLAAAETADRQNDVRIMTANCGAPFVENMYETAGNTSFIVACANRPESYGAQCVELIESALNGETLEGTYACSMTIVTWDNIAEVYPEDNLPWADLV